MIIIRCTSGVVGFKINYVRETDSLRWTCVNDSTSGTELRTAQGYQSLLTDIETKAVALKGAVQRVVDIPEIF